MDLKEKIAYKLVRLKKSRFRSRFKLLQKDLDYVHTRGIGKIREHAVGFLTERVADAVPRNDGKQTPMSGHPVFVAQHATATCCRGCIEKWYRIEKGRALTDVEIQLLTDVVMSWIDGQLKFESGN